VENQGCLLALVELEDILEKKAMIYSRLLTDPALAKEMEQRAARHEKRKEDLLCLALGEKAKKKKGEGMYELNGENVLK
jgi:hypothetical protein